MRQALSSSLAYKQPQEEEISIFLPCIDDVLVEKNAEAPSCPHKIGQLNQEYPVKLWTWRSFDDKEDQDCSQEERRKSINKPEEYPVWVQEYGSHLGLEGVGSGPEALSGEVFRC